MTDSILPDQSSFHHAVLRHLESNPSGDRQTNIYEAVADLLKLSPQQRAETLANLSNLKYRHRAGWSLGVLKKHGYLNCPSPKLWQLTDNGRDLLRRYPNGFEGKTMYRIAREEGRSPEPHGPTQGE